MVAPSEVFARIVRELESAPGVVLAASEIRPGVDAAMLAELEDAFEVTFDPALHAFWRDVGGVTIAWSMDRSRVGDVFSEDDLDYLAGAIAVLDPFLAVMGRGGQRWRDELWFDSMSAEEQQRFRRFVPFDFPTGEYAFGLRNEGGRVGPVMLQYDASDGIVPTTFDLESYVAHLARTRGLFSAHDPGTLPDPGLVERAIAYLSPSA